MKVEIRAGDKPSAEISGYINVVGRPSRILIDEKGKPFVEIMEPGVFRASLNKNPNIQLQYDHRQLLGDVAGANLVLEEDTIGLFGRAIVTEPKLIQKAINGLLRGWSFGYYPIPGQDVWERAAEGEVSKHIIKEIDLEEVSIIDDEMIPIYAGTSIQMRAEKLARLETRAYSDGNVQLINKVTPKIEIPDYTNLRKEIEFLKLKQRG